MTTFLRFTPQEYRAILQACAPLELGAGSFNGFQGFLVQSLATPFPALASRVAHFRRRQVLILLRHLKGARSAMVRQDGPARAGGTRPPHLTVEEAGIVSQAAGFLWLHDECRPSFKVCLLRLVEERSPRLARRLARMSDREIEALCRGCQRRAVQ
jgi:hypothetical protein